MRNDPVAGLKHVENARKNIAFVRLPWLMADQARQAIRECDTQYYETRWDRCSFNLVHDRFIHSNMCAVMHFSGCKSPRYKL